MSVTAKPLATAAYAPATETVVYTAPTGTRTIIDKYTAWNSDVAPIQYTVKLVPTGGTAGASHVVLTKTIAPSESYTMPEIVGHVLEAGGFISEVASTANKLVRRISGREVSS
jgi:ABC-type uncharacterized transport system YnjBCD substrate-binding protein